ncbi:MAG: L,D-transpeptidase/peptidoglycan binding protein [Ruminococcus sp.]|nr:L,D-transpeptidase/peptidoglycan binding protein [Ruminococcus sp.]
MKKKKRENLKQNHQGNLNQYEEEYFLDDIEDEDENSHDEEYWLDDEEEALEDKDQWIDDDSEEELEEAEEFEDDEEFLEDDEEDVEEDSDEEIEEIDDTEDEEPDLKKKKKGSKKVWKVLGIAVGVLAAAYVGVSVFFMSHFYINTTINGKDFSAKTVEDVEKYMSEQVQGYVLTIHEKDNVDEQITGEEISLVYEKSSEIEDALNKQNGFLWPMAFFNTSATEVTIHVSYDEAKLNIKIENLQALKVEQTPPTSAYPKFDGEAFVIEPEVTGNAVDMEVLKEKVGQYITEFKAELDMDEDNCYLLPEYTSESEELQKVCDEMNTYLKASITYKMKEDVVLDKQVIHEWITVNDKLEVKFNEDAVKEWLAEFGNTYDTVGTTRTITSPSGKSVEVSGGDYGWSIDEDKEYEAIIKSIKAGEVVEKEPAYYQTAASHSDQDWGTTYAEVDLSAQHMWMIVDGAVAMECDVVTGKPGGWETPQGVYGIKWMASPTVLKGEIQPDTGKPEYETPVDYWMCITWSGIGFHDATWQPAFGGSLYLNGYGSHGCVNMPYNSAATLYGMLSEGVPVVMHY